jgi:4-hydroxy-tetrahydrodipicolinate reductase
MTINVCIAGATGWVGKPLCQAVLEADDLRLVGAVSPTRHGHPIQEIVKGTHNPLTISGSVEQALETPTDVMVDFTNAQAVKANVMTAIRQGVNVVIGSSGLTDDDFSEINKAALDKKVGVVAAGNFAITAVLLERFACEAAKYLPHWEIIDYASDTKTDAPSGTTRELAYRLSQVRKPEISIPIEETVGRKESRGTTLDGSQIHSLRLPSYVISVEAIFGAPDERLSIRHDSGSGVTPYIQGTLLAIRKVGDRVGLIRGLDKIMD